MTDSQIIEELGGSTAVAKIIKEKTGQECTAQRVQNWKERGIPAQMKLDHPEIFLQSNNHIKQSA